MSTYVRATLREKNGQNISRKIDTTTNLSFM